MGMKWEKWEKVVLLFNFIQLYLLEMDILVHHAFPCC